MNIQNPIRWHCVANRNYTIRVSYMDPTLQKLAEQRKEKEAGRRTMTIDLGLVLRKRLVDYLESIEKLGLKLRYSDIIKSALGQFLSKEGF